MYIEERVSQDGCRRPEGSSVVRFASMLVDKTAARRRMMPVSKDWIANRTYCRRPNP